jgi:small subunit ribosomal protein S17
MQSNSASKILRKKKGVVVSDKMDKTIVVEVTTLKTHSKYLKKYRSTKKYKVHDEKNVFKVGDIVSFQECKPISKDKRWMVVA